MVSIGWEPIVFFRVLPDCNHTEAARQFLCWSNHWSDKLLLLENDREYNERELMALKRAPLFMLDRRTGLQVMGFEGGKTLMIRRDVFDLLEAIGIKDFWWENRSFNFVEMARRAGARVAIWEDPGEIDGDKPTEMATNGDEMEMEPQFTDPFAISKLVEDNEMQLELGLEEEDEMSDM
jgi:hypothetical protein